MTDFDHVLIALNNSQTQKTNAPLYQAIKTLLSASKTSRDDLDQLVSNLDQKISSTFMVGSNADRLIYKPQDPVNGIIYWTDSATGKVYIQFPGSSGWVPLTGADPNASYITANDETADLIHSRQLIAGTNITLDTSVGGKIKISSSAAGSGGVVAGYIVNDGSPNANAGPILIASKNATVAKVKAVVKQIGSSDFKFDFLRNGISILTAGIATIPTTSIPSTIISIGASAAVVADDLFILSIYQGNPAWNLTIQAES